VIGGFPNRPSACRAQMEKGRMQPQSDPNAEFYCFYARGFLQQYHRRVGMITSLKFLRLAEYPEFGEPDDTYLPFVHNPDYRGALTPYQVNVSKWYSVEVTLEEVRREHFAHLPSRLSVIYVFHSLEEAQKAHPQYSQFRDRELVRLRPTHCDILCSYSRHDMRWVDLLREYDFTGSDLAYAVRSYWEGRACKGPVFHGQMVNADPLWETLYDGALQFVD
jgi:hypothetical protein